MSEHLDLLKRVLTGYVFPDSADHIMRKRPVTSPRIALVNFVLDQLGRRNFRLLKRRPFNAEARENGSDWPSIGYTMCGLKRLSLFETAIDTVINENIPGDIVQCGVWKGGSAMFMKAVLKEKNADRTIWLADSFEGLPRPDAVKYPADAKFDLSQIDYLSVPDDQVRENFKRFDLFDDKIKLLKGWFSKTLPTAPIKQISILHADGDLYESTMDILTNLYDKVSPGGFVIIDDYYSLDACEKAVEDFRRDRKITAPMTRIDTESVYWRV